MEQPLATTLRISTTGEALRSVFALRLKEQDRVIGRYERAIAVAKAEMEEVQKETEQGLSRVRARTAFVPPGLSAMAGAGHHVDVASFQRAVDMTENKLEALKHNRATLAWLRDQFQPDQRYELSSFDLNLLGFNERSLSEFSGGGPHDLLGQICC